MRPKVWPKNTGDEVRFQLQISDGKTIGGITNFYEVPTGTDSSGMGPKGTGGDTNSFPPPRAVRISFDLMLASRSQQQHYPSPEVPHFSMTGTIKLQSSRAKIEVKQQS